MKTVIPSRWCWLDPVSDPSPPVASPAGRREAGSEKRGAERARSEAHERRRQQTATMRHMSAAGGLGGCRAPRSQSERPSIRLRPIQTSTAVPVNSVLSTSTAQAAIQNLRQRAATLLRCWPPVPALAAPAGATLDQVGARSAPMSWSRCAGCWGGGSEPWRPQDWMQNGSPRSPPTWSCPAARGVPRHPARSAPPPASRPPCCWH